jgi:RHS repeat-associated protein
MLKIALLKMGRRIWRKSGTEIIWFLFSDEGLIQELTDINSEIKTYGWNPGGMWGTDTVWQKDRNGTFFTSNDHLYTTDNLTSANDGVTKWQAIRESFGKTNVKNGAAIDYRMRFPGQWEDTENAFSYNWWREYQREFGRYTTLDPVMATSDGAGYAYVRSSPLNRVDIQGAFSKAWNSFCSDEEYAQIMAAYSRVARELVQPCNCTDDKSGCVSCRFRKLMLEKLSISTFKCRAEYIPPIGHPRYEEACADAQQDGTQINFFGGFFQEAAYGEGCFCSARIIVHEAMHLLGYDHAMTLKDEENSCRSKLCN